MSDSTTVKTMLSPVEIARQMGVSKPTVRRWIKQGYLPAVRIGAVIRIKQSDFAAFLAWHAIDNAASRSDEQ